MFLATSLKTADGKDVDVYAEKSGSETSEEDYDDLNCFWCEIEIDNYEDEAFYHQLTKKWYCEFCYVFMLENE